MIEVTRGQSSGLFLGLNSNTPLFPAGMLTKGSGWAKLGDLGLNSIVHWVPEPSINVG